MDTVLDNFDLIMFVITGLVIIYVGYTLYGSTTNMPIDSIFYPAKDKLLTMSSTLEYGGMAILVLATIFAYYRNYYSRMETEA